MPLIQQQMFEPSESDLVREAMSQPLKSKIENSIKLIQLHATDEPYVCCDSYGKDSSCILQLTKMSGVNYRAVHSLTTLDPPELIRFGKQHRLGTEVIRRDKALLQRMLDRPSGPPTRMVRWCCEEYKENTGNGYNKIIGVRAAESKRREGWKQVVATKQKKIMLCPILYWTEDDVWEFHKIEKLPYCELYDQGFSRLGCVGCPMTSKKQRLVEFERWPRYEKLWRLFITRYWEKWKDVPNTRTGELRMWSHFKSGDEVFDWWMGDDVFKDSGGCQFDFMYT